jgi:hypothetical protein
MPLDGDFSLLFAPWHECKLFEKIRKSKWLLPGFGSWRNGQFQQSFRVARQEDHLNLLVDLFGEFAAAQPQHDNVGQQQVDGKGKRAPALLGALRPMVILCYSRCA